MLHCLPLLLLFVAGALPLTLAQVYASCVLGGAMLNGTIPLFYELAMETVYPIAEGSASGFLVRQTNAALIRTHKFLLMKMTTTVLF